MSSILKALKRVEESTPPEADAAAPARTPGLAEFRSSRRRKLRRRVLLLACAAAAVAAAASGYFFFLRGPTEPPLGATAAAGPSPGAIRAPLPLPPAAPTSSPAASPPAAGSEQGAVTPPPLPARPRAQVLPPRPARPAPTAPRPAAPARSEAERLSKLDSSKLKLMAIAWYAEPSRRIAVINGSIVKEGESVEGYRISEIRKDDVIVSEGTRSWRVEFGLRSQP